MKPLASSLAAFVLFAGVAYAHKPSDSYLTLTQPGQGTVLDGQWDIALRDLQHAVGIDANGDGIISWGELRQRERQIVQYAFSRLTLEGIAHGDRNRCRL